MDKIIPFVSPKILSQYKRADTVCVVNDNDSDLTPIEIKLPKCPPIHLIDGYGLPAAEQKFKREVMPKKLYRLQNEPAKNEQPYTIDEIWKELANNKSYYKAEIKLIEKHWYHRLNGYWFFNNGKPTYIDGWHWFYLNFWELDEGLPEYRSRDRKFFLFARMCYNDPLCYGFNYPKHRREGATSKASCINYEIVSRSKKKKSGIQSMTEKDAENVFQNHIVQPWKTVPFYFKPLYEGSSDPKTVLRFNPPAIRMGQRGSMAGTQKGLNSSISFRNANTKAYDGHKLIFYHADEVGKTIECDIRDRWNIAKHCLAQGKNIIGFCIQTSTVGEMEKEGGINFRELCKNSDYHKRSPIGQTGTGLYTLFISGADGLESFVDEYGDSKYEEALTYLKEKRKFLLLNGDFQALDAEIRQTPIFYKECFRTNSKSSGFNLHKIEQRLEFFRFGNNAKVKGDFRWVNNIRDKEVEFVPNPDGRFWVSLQLGDFEANRKYWDSSFGDEGSWLPSNFSKFVAGGDAFKFNTTISGKKSNGGGAVFQKRDHRVDKDDKNTEDWKTHRFVCTYSNRPKDKDDYGEDMLMMCVYYGCYMFPELDVPFLWDYFERRKYSGFLLHRVDSKTGKYVITPGISSNSAKQDIFYEVMTYIERHSHRENHDEFLEECKDIEGPEDMTHYDLFAAAGYALLGANATYTEYQQTEEEPSTDIIIHRRYVM